MTRARTALALVATTLVLALAACTTPTTMPTPTATPTAEPSREPSGDGVLRIGTIIPTSGNFAFLAPAQLAGIGLALADINVLGGVNGAGVQVLNRDSGDASGSVAEASFADLVANGTDVIIGPSSSAIAQRLVPLALDAKVPFISPAATFPGLSAAPDAGFAYRTVASYGNQGYALADALAGKKVALLYVDDELGRSLAETLDSGLEAVDGELVLSTPVSASTTDLNPMIQGLKDAAPDAVVIASAYSTFDLTKALIAQTLATGYGAGRLWLTTQNTGDYNQAFPPGTLAGVLGVIDGVEPDETFKARLKQVDPNLGTFRYSMEAYDATILAALAAIVAGDDAGAAIAASLDDVSRGGIKCTTFAECLEVLKTQSDIDYDGISGSLDFTPEGDVSQVYYGLYAYDGDNKFVFQRTVMVR